MKVDFKAVLKSVIEPGIHFFLYGNNKRTFHVFCDYVVCRLKNVYQNLDVRFCKPGEDPMVQEDDLFDRRITCVCIRDIEDRHQKYLQPLLDNTNVVLILEAGNFTQSKTITEYFAQSRLHYAVASFKNELTFRSLCSLLFPEMNLDQQRAIASFMESTDEELFSLSRKISLLDRELLNNYLAYKVKSIENVEMIPLIRYFLKIALQMHINGSDSSSKKLPKDMLSFLLETEAKIKSGIDLPRSFIYHKISCEQNT